MSTSRLPPRDSKSDSMLTREDSGSAVASILSGIARTCLLLILVAAPWFLGGWNTQVQYWLYVGVLVALAIWVISASWQACTTGLNTNRLPITSLPLLGSLILGQYQLSPRTETPSAESIQSAIESSTSIGVDEEQRRQLATKAMVQSLQTGRSISPSSTRLEMSRLIIVVATFFLGTQIFATKTSQQFLWGTLAINGAALSFLGIAQQQSWNGKIYWMIPLSHGGHPFASFVNRNNAAGYLCICLGAALGFALWAFSTSLPLVRSEYRSTKTRADSPRRRRFSMTRLVDGISRLSAIQIMAGVLVVLIAAGVIMAMSRGGWLALGVASIITILIASRSITFSTTAFVATASVFIAGFVTWADAGNRLGGRWQQFASIDAFASDGRWGHWSDSLHAVRDFPFTGTGFGTYQFSYLPYQTHASTSHLRFYNADNQFVEWLVEGGFVGLSIVLLFLLLNLNVVRVLLKKSRIDPSDPSGIVGVFFVISQSVSAFFDFGPTMPANMLALATVFGALAGRASLLVNLNQIRHGKWLLTLPRLRPAGLIPVVGVALLVVGAWELREVQAAAVTQAVSRRLPESDSPDGLDEASVSELIDQLSVAVSHRPDDSDSQLALANLWILKFRVQQVALEMENQPDVSIDDLWQRTSPIALFRLVNSWESSGQIERIETLIETQNCLVQAYDHLVKAQSACLLSPGTDQLMATLAFVARSEHQLTEIHLRRAVVVAPANPNAFYIVGELALLGGMTDFSFACLKRSLELSPKYLLEIHQSINGQFSLEEELEKAIPNDGGLIVELAETYTREDDRASRHELANHAVRLLSVPLQEPKDADRRHNLGKAYILLGEFDEAIREYQSALLLSPLEVQWRVELTWLLFKNKGISYALREAQIGAALVPGNRQFQYLVRELQSRNEIRSRSR